jgi:hypothetical protein
MTVSKWQRSEKLDNTFAEQKSETLILNQASDNKKSKREAEDWLTAIDYVRTKH